MHHESYMRFCWCIFICNKVYIKETLNLDKYRVDWCKNYFIKVERKTILCYNTSRIMW